MGGIRGWGDPLLTNGGFGWLCVSCRYHKYALRSVAFHPRLPLFATASDDASVHILHCTVPTDLSENVTIVPLTILHNHSVTDAYGVMDVVFHPSQPWILTAGADHTARLYT